MNQTNNHFTSHSHSHSYFSNQIRSKNRTKTKPNHHQQTNNHHHSSIHPTIQPSNHPTNSTTPPPYLTAKNTRRKCKPCKNVIDSHSPHLTSAFPFFSYNILLRFGFHSIPFLPMQTKHRNEQPHHHLLTEITHSCVHLQSWNRRERAQGMYEYVVLLLWTLTYLPLSLFHSILLSLLILHTHERAEQSR